MQATFVKFEQRHRQLLQEKARRDGCSLSDLIRHATIHFFDLPTDGPNMANVEQSAGESHHGSPPVEPGLTAISESTVEEMLSPGARDGASSEQASAC